MYFVIFILNMKFYPNLIFSPDLCSNFFQIIANISFSFKPNVTIFRYRTFLRFADRFSQVRISFQKRKWGRRRNRRPRPRLITRLHKHDISLHGAAGTNKLSGAANALRRPMMLNVKAHLTSL